MHKIFRGIKFIIAGLLLIILLCPNISYAINCEYFQEGVSYDGITALEYPDGIKNSAGTLVTGQVIQNSDKVRRPGLSFKLVSCIEDMLSNTLKTKVESISANMKNITATMLVLYFIFFGFKVAMCGVLNLRGEFAVTLFTSLAVVYFAYNGGAFEYLTLFKESQAAMTSAMTSSMDSGSMVGNSVCIYSNVWLKFDCIIASVLGAYDPSYGGGTTAWADPLAAYGTDGSESFLARLIGGLLFSDIGLIYAIFVIMIVVVMVVVLAQAVIVFLSSILVITFLGILSPIMIPLILFEQTKTFFDKWLELFFGYFLQPILVIGYLVFMLDVIGFMLNRDCVDASGAASKCGLLAVYADANANVEDKISSDVKICAKTNLAKAADKQSGAECNDLEKKSDNESSAIRSTSFKFSQDLSQDLFKKVSFLQELIITALLFFILFSFLTNLFSNASAIANIAAEGIGTHTQTYNNSMISLKNASERINRK